MAVKGGYVTINDGYFGAWDKALYIGGDDTKVKIYGGKFDKTDTTYDWYQDYGVYCNGGVLYVYGGEGCTVTDDGVDVDINTKADYFGKSYLRIKSNLPHIERQPESVDTFAGDEVVFKIKAENATRYVWYICDADDESEQPYSWEDLKQYYDISGENTDTLVIRNVKSWFNNKGISCTVYNDNGWVYSQNVYLNVTVKSDVNSDKVFGISDIVMMQKYLVNAGELTDMD